jgi:ATP-dependent DNA helicase RecQ
LRDARDACHVRGERAVLQQHVRTKAAGGFRLEGEAGGLAFYIDGKRQEILHHERLRPKNVNLDPDRYSLLKNSALERMQKMIDYVNEDDTCRSSYLLDYFGQEESDDCGTCDICRSSGKVKKQIKSYIIDEMNGSYTLEDITRRYGSATSDSPDYQRVLRQMIDDGTVPPPEI